MGVLLRFRLQIAWTLVLVAALAAVVLYNSNAQTILSKAQTDASSLQLQLDAEQSTLAQYIRKGNPNPNNDNIDAEVPIGVQLPAIILSTQAMATQMGVSIQSIQLGSGGGSGSPATNFSQTMAVGFQSQQVDMLVQGSSKALLQFIHGLEHETRLTNVQSFAISAATSKAANSSMATISYLVYYRNKN